MPLKISIQNVKANMTCRFVGGASNSLLIEAVHSVLISPIRSRGVDHGRESYEIRHFSYSPSVI